MSDPNEVRPLRVMVFPDRPDVLLVYVPVGQQFWIPSLQTPLTRNVVAQALRDHDIAARVVESTAGRFTRALARAQQDAKAERGSKEREREAAACVQIHMSPTATTYEKKRAELIAEKHKVDDELRTLKAEIGRAKATAFTSGKYMAVSEYRGKEERAADLATLSLAIQNRLSSLKQAKIAAEAALGPAREKRFIQAVKALLDPDEYQEMWKIANGDEEIP